MTLTQNPMVPIQFTAYTLMIIGTAVQQGTSQAMDCAVNTGSAAMGTVPEDCILNGKKNAMDTAAN